MSEAEIDRMLATFRDVPVQVVSATGDQVDAAVDLKWHYNISYAVGFAAALSIELTAVLFTGDRELRALEADGLLQLFWVGA